jgi:hypothetical protein
VAAFVNRRGLRVAAGCVVGWLASTGAPADAAGTNWQELRGRHFLVQFTGPRPSAEQVAARAEDEYGRIAAELGYTRYDGFWTWERRVTIVLYPTRQAFLDASQAPAWAAGKADARLRTISSYLYGKTLAEALRTSYPDPVGTLEGLEAAWLAHLRKGGRP